MVEQLDREALGRRVREVWVEFARANPEPCNRCRGTGKAEACANCAWSGDSTEDHVCPPPVDCSRCGGTGKVVKPSHVAPWEALSEHDREVDRRIGETIAREAAATPLARVRELEALINSPAVDGFWDAVRREAAHQAERWRADDPGKGHADWFWLIGYLAGKALHDPPNGVPARERRLHRIITVAAAAYHWWKSAGGAGG